MRRIFCLLSVLLILLGTACGQRQAPTVPRTPVPTVAAPAPAAMDVLEAVGTIAASALPREARDTLALIEQGGPFHYRRDGVVFQNRESLLPQRERGYYREYTVPTPGADDRGARRIISGKSGEYYYSDDHYRSFRRIAP